MYASLAKGWYFGSSTDGWGIGGLTKIKVESGMFVITGGDAQGPRVWSNGSEPNNIPAETFDTIRIRLKTECTEPEVMLWLTYGESDARGVGPVGYQIDETGWAIVTMDVSKLDPSVGGKQLTKMLLCPLGQNKANWNGKNV